MNELLDEQLREIIIVAVNISKSAGSMLSEFLKSDQAEGKALYVTFLGFG
jgi:hypothetical protein